jgi:hypothetical protein
MGVFMNKRRELHGGREPAQEVDAPAARHTESAAEIVNERYCDPSCEDRCLESLGRGAWIS